MDGFVLEGERLYVSFPEDLEDEHLAYLERTIPETIHRRGIRGLIVDLSALPFVDGFTLDAVRRLARTAKLLGAVTVICGIGPGAAASLVNMGRDLDELPVAADKGRAEELLEGMGKRGKGKTLSP